MNVRYSQTQYGFDFGAASITRMASDRRRGWVVIGLQTPKHKDNKSIQIYVTKSGKVRIADASGEWRKP